MPTVQTSGCADRRPPGSQVRHTAPGRHGDFCVFHFGALDLATGFESADGFAATHTSELFIILVPATLVLLLGIYDDLRGTNAVVKFVALGLIASLFYAMGGRIEVLGNSFCGGGPFSSRDRICYHCLLAGGNLKRFQLDRWNRWTGAGRRAVFIGGHPGGFAGWENPLMVVVALCFAVA